MRKMRSLERCILFAECVFLVHIHVSQQIIHFPFILLADCISRDGSLAGMRQDMTLYMQFALIFPVEFQLSE